jgi:NADH:ubiquinone oxidoreductase subunit C
MPAQIVVVKRPRGGLYARVRSVPAWLRAAWRGDAAGGGRQSSSTGTTPRAPEAPDATVMPTPDGSAHALPGAVPLNAAALSAAFAEQGGVLDRARDGMLRLEVPAAEAMAVLRRLREEPALGFDRLMDLTVVDRSDASGRLEVVYLLEASARDERLRVHAALEPESAEIASAVPLWPAADWPEREAAELFGVRFRGHPGLHRLLLPVDFEGAPMRRGGGTTRDAVEDGFA